MNSAGEQQSFFVAPGPSVEQLAIVSGQCTDAEWQRLVQNHSFISAACRSLDETADLATQLLGRKISVSTNNPSAPGGPAKENQ